MNTNGKQTPLQMYLEFCSLTRKMREKACVIYSNSDNKSYEYLKNQLRDDYEKLKEYWNGVTDQNIDSCSNLIRHITFGDSKHGGTGDYWDILSNDLKELEIFLDKEIVGHAKKKNFLIYNKPEFFHASQEITNLSPSFQQIYNQAEVAESIALLQICGLGYRKSLEFLIKDFCIYFNPDKAESIKKTRLSLVISNYIDDSNIKDCAERAAWLGNDETHYVKKWIDKDIDDLKKLILLTVNWMLNYISTCQYRDSMHKITK